ncbi:MAG: response regulator [Candidatus Omnitrophica bacterium]|nr:response regulator [Candidatus Omnitrophota bacterium]
MPTLLLVTHDDVLANAYRARLIREGFTVERCRGGNDALTLGRQCHPDLLLLDLVLPGIHGLDVLKWLTDVPALVKVPVLLLTEHTVAPDILEECLFWGAKGAIHKDLASLADVVARVRRLLQPPARSAATAPASTAS